jgi:chromosome segregation ATPase
VDQTAKDQVLQEITALEQQVENYTNEMDSITSTEPLDTAKYNAVKADLDAAQGKLDAKRTELATIEDAGKEAQEKLTAELDAIDIGGETVNLRALVPDEASYQLLYIWLQQREITKAQVMAALKSSYESQIEEFETVANEISTLRQENYRLSDKCADLEAKRDAAAAQIDELQGDITRLKADNDNLRKQLEDSAKPKETTEDAKAALERWKNSRPAITDLRWKDDSRKTTYLATLVETGEPIEFGYLEKGKYRELSEEEASRFRAEQAENEPVQSSETNVIPDSTLGDSIPLEPPVIDFPNQGIVWNDSENKIFGNTVQAESVPGTMVLSTEEITRRLIALEARVDQIAGA